MAAKLNLVYSLLAYSDTVSSSNPSLRNIDWKRSNLGLPIKNPKSEGFEVLPGTEMTLFSTEVATSIDNTTEFGLSLLLIGGGSRYRLLRTAGTSPAFRTDRGLALSGETVDVTVNANGTITLDTSGVVNDFASVLSGDIVFIPHTTTGDSASPLSPVNVGLWKVLAKLSNTSLQLARLAGTDFLASSESGVAIASDSQIQAFSESGVQVGDKVDIVSGFSEQATRSFVVAAVTPDSLDFISTEPIPNQTGVLPGANGIHVFRGAKRMVLLEADQQCVVRANGDTGSYQRLDPWEAADSNLVGTYLRTGPTWMLKVYNRSSFVLNLTLISGE